jgi:hypothetical protein
MDDKYYTTEEEIAKIIYDTDIYEKIRTVTQKANYETNYLIWVISVNINTHYSHFLQQYENPSPERTKYLTDHIEGELSYYLIEAKQASEKKP